MTSRPRQRGLLSGGGWGRRTPRLAVPLPLGLRCPAELRLSKPRSQEIVKRYSILISRALKSVKKTVRENYQEHANEVKSSADTREVFMPAPRRTGIAGSQQGACRWSGARRDPGLGHPAGFAPLPLDIATLSLGFFFFFFFFLTSLELNDISSSEGAAGRLEIVQ